MKTLNAIAREIGITHQAIYKGIPPELRNRCATNEKGKKLYDEESERLIKEYFAANAQPLRNKSATNAQPTHGDIAYYRDKIEELEADLREERERYNEMVEKYEKLAMRLADISADNQKLLALEKMPWWRKIIKRKE